MSTESKNSQAMAAVFSKIATKSFPAPPAGSIVTIDSGSSMIKAIQLLTKHNILAAPIHDSSKKDSSDWTRDYVGMISTFDICAFMLGVMKKTHGWGKGFEAVFEAVDSFASVTVAQVHEKSERDPFLAVSEESTLLDVMLFLGKHHAHRVVVVSQDKLVNIITQSAMVKLLADLVAKNSELAAHAKKSLKQLGLAEPKKVWSVPLAAQAITAFNLIVSKKVSGVPVLDEHGVVVGNISNRDIRAMVAKPALFERIYENVGEFLNEIRADRKEEAKGKGDAKNESKGAGAAGAGKVLAPAVCCHAEESLETVIGEFVKLGIHRMYIVDKDHKCTGVVSLTDVIGAFVSEEPEASP